MDTSPNSAKDLEIELVDDSENIVSVNESEDEKQGETENEPQDNENPDLPAVASFADDKNDDTDSRLIDARSNYTKGDSKLNVCTSSSETNSVRSRVFVGHLNTDKATRRDLEKLFSSCGKIEAVSMLNGYGFVQFDNEESACKAIDKYHGTSFFGIRLVVDKPAAWKRLDGENPRDSKPWPKDSRRLYPSDDDQRHYDRHRRTCRRDSDNFYNDIPFRYRYPEYERYLEMRYMEQRLAERYRYDRLYNRYPPHSNHYANHMSYREMDRYDYPPPRGYDYPRDDDYDRERRPFNYGYR